MPETRLRVGKRSVGIVLALALLVFVAQKEQVVDVNFLAWSLEMSRAIMLLAVLAIGFVLGWLVSSIGRLKD